MVDHSRGIQLHDKATRGQPLTPTEQTELDNWYAVQDAEEAQQLRPLDVPPTSNLQQLQKEHAQLLEQLALVTQRIQQLVAENNRLRAENSVLMQRLPQLA